MAKQQSSGQKSTVGRVMHEFKHGELESSQGGKVRNPRQAIAIALSEAGASNRQSPAENRRNYRRTKEKERTGQTAQAEKEGSRRRSRDDRTRAELYQEASRRQIRGRSRMSKAELEQALAR
jgi:hypothetical protein